MRTAVVLVCALVLATDAEAAKKKRKSKQDLLIEQTKRSQEAAQQALQAAEDAKKQADEAKRELRENKAADEKRRQDEAALRQVSEEAQRKQAEDDKRNTEQAQRARDDAQKAKEDAQAAATKAEQDKRDAEKAAAEAKLAQEQHDYTHVVYLRAGAGIELYDASFMANGLGRGVAPLISGSIGYRLGMVRLGFEYQGAILNRSASWHKGFFNTEIVLGTSLIEFCFRFGLGYALAVPGGGGALIHGAAGKAGIGLDFRFIPVMAIGFGGDLDVMMMFASARASWPIGGSVFGRFSFFF